MHGGPSPFETVFSTDEKVDFVRRSMAGGYFTRLFYVGTDDPAINAARIADRVLEGGHDVPIPEDHQPVRQVPAKPAKNHPAG